MTQKLNVRSPAFYRATIAIAAVGVAYLVLSGRLGLYLRMFRPGHPVPNAGEFASHFTTALIWIVAVAPLLFAAWEVGRQHVRARRFGYSIFVGLRGVFRMAVTGTPDNELSAHFARSPTDRPLRAALLGLLAAAAVPSFFLALAPPLRTGSGEVWVGVAGVLVGVMTYCHHRAMAYLRDEPDGWLFRKYQLLNPARYEPPGRPFVRVELLTAFTLPIWWLAWGTHVMR